MLHRGPCAPSCALPVSSTSSDAGTEFGSGRRALRAQILIAEDNPWPPWASPIVHAVLCFGMH